MNNLNQAIERISSIDWDHIGERETKSHVHLCKEYLRRASNFINDFPGLCIFPFIMISNSITKPQKNIRELQILQEISDSFHRTIVTSYLELFALIDEGNRIAIENKDLFEPVIKLYERGGFFYKREGFLNVAGEFLTLTNRANIEPLDISNETLDVMDIEMT